MPTLTPARVYQLARDAGLDATQAVVATAVAMAESGLRTDAVGDTSLQNGTWGPSVGLWQIRSLKADAGTGRARDDTRLTDPVFNARAMAEVSAGGTNWRPWSVFTSGKYRSHLDQVTNAAGQPRHPCADDASGSVDNAPTIGGGLLDQLNPLAVFDGWSGELLGVGLKLTVTAAALALVVTGAVRAVSR